MRRRLHTGSKRFSFEYSICDVVIHLSSHSTVAVAVDNLTFTWVRGSRKTAPKRARVVEKLDQTSGELLRTAALPGELHIPCTLFRHGGDDGRWESKLSHLHVGDADEEAEVALLCAVPLELSAYAATASQPLRRAHIELSLADGMGSLHFAITSKLQLGAGADDVSLAGSEVSNIHDLDGMGADEPTREMSHSGSAGIAPSAADPRARDAPHHARDATEARWQQVYELEREKADAATIERLEADVSGLIVAKRAMQEEILKLRTTLDAVPVHRKVLGERVAGLEAQLSASKREAAANEEALSTAFNSLVRTLEGEVASLTAQRDAANERLDIVERKNKNLRRAAPPAHTHVASHAAASHHAGHANQLAGAHGEAHPDPLHPHPPHLNGASSAHGASMQGAPAAGHVAGEGAEESSGKGKGASRLRYVRRALSFEGKTKRKAASAPAPASRTDDELPPTRVAPVGGAGTRLPSPPSPPEVSLTLRRRAFK